MSNELTPFRPPAIFRSRRLSRPSGEAARRIFEEVKLAGLHADGVVALTSHALEDVVDLDALRQRLGADNLGLSVTLAEIEAAGIRKIQKILGGLYSDSRFGL